uniref:AIF family member 3 n=1 Tax=Gasterosteus aculeatus aculeatus TaxID=481459 RepID=A0AAQ4R1P3_GASAC
MGGCFSKPKPVEVKVELSLLEKEKDVDGLSPNGKASPFADCRPNGALGHGSDDDSTPPPLYHKARDYVEASVCHVKDLENGQMREVDLGSGRALLIKEHGEFSAMAHKCPHYGAPLVKGVLSKGHVRCPWHGACFDIATGDLEDFPGLDSLPTFQVTVPAGAVLTHSLTSVINSSSGFSHVLIIGSGPAGLVCAETLRQEGFTDRIVMCTKDRHPPYDRPKLSKSLESTAEQLRLRSMDFLQDHDIELLVDKEAVSIDVKTRSVTFEDGSRMEYKKLFIIEQHYVLVIYFLFAQLKEVVLKSGKVLRADVCVIGAGSIPATGFLKQSGIHMDSRGFITVNKMMQTNADGVFAGGDVVVFPFPPRHNKKVNIPHWQMAHVHGRVAALGMMGRPADLKTVPYFWSAMFGKTIRYAGYGDGFDDVIIQGDLDELRFVAFYTRGEEVVAVASMNYDPIVSRVAEVLGSGKTIRKRDVETGDISWLIDKGPQ